MGSTGNGIVSSNSRTLVRNNIIVQFAAYGFDLPPFSLTRWLDRFPFQLLLKLHRAEIIQAGMHAFPVVPAFNPCHDRALGFGPRRPVGPVHPLVLNEPKKLSTTALSQQLPLRLMLPRSR